ncbi:hypothetical protein NP233_g7563 [Leucocoprinus birnbaumii]|uniref:F-box domain-containing protein n=1 Tax=Leucocoprinus birnbaumii TaxID=56174 RepID=A0AAD5VSB0_9AGAR|nr:hypothetical protein NP233_g7563 [Leucocoprinus birnbaumii]
MRLKSFLGQETAVYDHLSDIDSVDLSDEDSLPSTPIMSTADRIEELYYRLQRMREDLERFHREQSIDDEDDSLLDNGWMDTTKPSSHGSYWEEDEEDSYLEEDYSCLSERSTVEPPTEREARMVSPSMCWIGRMPTEIMVYIFEMVSNAEVDLSDDAAGFGGREGWRTPIILGQVCFSWRMLTLETPSLWRSLSLVLGRIPKSWRGLEASLKLWLGSSKEIAVNLEVDPVCTSAFDNELMDQLEQLLKRCWKLRLNVSHEMFRGILSLPLPRLQALEVRSSWLAKDIGQLSIDAPRLQELAVLGPTMVKFRKNALPWAQLREYRGVCWADVQEHLDIIRLSPNLESCTLYPFYEMKGTATPIRLQQLQRLHVASYLGASMGGFLRWLELPVLKELRLEVPKESAGFGCSVWPKSSVLDLLERSSVELEKLELVGMDCS